jgi:hypothetical protein
MFGAVNSYDVLLPTVLALVVVLGKSKELLLSTGMTF